MDHRFFQVHVLAGIHRVHGGLLVPVIRRRDDDGVDVWALQNFAIVARREEVLAPKLLRVCKPAIVAVRDGDNLGVGHLQSRRCILLAPNTRADQGKLNLVIWAAL